MQIKENYSLIRHNTFHLPITTRWFIEYENETELVKMLAADFLQQNKPHLHIGGGSNLLFLNDYEGIILHSGIKGINLIHETDQSVLIRVGAAEIWDDVVAYTVDKGWGGIENLSLIPGETGAAAVQNIGAYGVEIKDVIENVETYNSLTHEKRIFANEECQFRYRNSVFKQTDSFTATYIVLRLQKNPVFQLDYGNLRELLSQCESLTVQKVREAIINIRSQKLPDPNKLGNAGSFFINPVVTQEKLIQLKQDYPSIPSFPAQKGNVKLSAAWLIEQCGLKGKRFGNVGIYERHALVIVNYGSATGIEIAQLAEHIRKIIHQRFGVLLEPEVKYVG